MRAGWTCFVLMTLGLMIAGGPRPWTPPSAMAQDYPYQGQPLVADGVVNHVDAGRDRVTFTSDDGRTFTLDTSQADITLLDGNRAGLTGDLSSGMRVHVHGQLLSADIAEVDQMRVLPALPSGSTRPAEIELRGTVDSVDTQNGSFVVRIKDKVGSHTRAILLADNTDLSGLGRLDPSRFPVKPGDRVTVGGILQPDGAVLAGVLSLSRTVSLPPSVTLPRSAPFWSGACPPSATATPVGTSKSACPRLAAKWMAAK